LLDLSGRVALVTGAGSGFGRVVARRFAEAGARVAVHYRASREGAEAVAREIAAGGGEARAFAADLTQDGEAERLVEGVVSAMGPLGVLVNNAGSYPLADLLQVKAAEWDRVLAENLRAPSRAAGRRTPRRTPRGAIVNVTSIQAFRPAPQLARYSAPRPGSRY
jgi:NAD(P)-dependent dehydrogenase (short-subunit alcohol dehydrogenase family)